MSSLLFQNVAHTLVAFPSNTSQLLVQLGNILLGFPSQSGWLGELFGLVNVLASNKVYQCLSFWAAVTKYHRLGDW